MTEGTNCERLPRTLQVVLRSSTRNPRLPMITKAFIKRAFEQVSVFVGQSQFGVVASGVAVASAARNSPTVTDTQSQNAAAIKRRRRPSLGLLPFAAERPVPLGVASVSSTGTGRG